MHTFLASIRRVGGGRCSTETCTHDGLTIAIDGYVVRPPGTHPPGADADFVAERYAAGGPDAVEQLDGSFVIVLVDARVSRVLIWTDRAATRACFCAILDNTLVLAPELKCFRALGTLENSRATALELVPGSLAAMAMNGALLDEHTYYRGVRLVGPARRIAVERSGIHVTRYWTRTFSPVHGQHAPTPADVADRVCAATARHLASFERPVLALSGGLDSRIILAAARRLKLTLPTLTWGFDHVDTPGSDFQVGRAAAERAGSPHGMRPMDVDQLPQNAARVVALTDGLTGHLGNYTEADAVARELAADHDAVVRGDEMFGWAASVATPAEALRRVGINVGKRQRLLRFLLRRDAVDVVLADYHAQCRQLLASIDATTPDDIKDILYWRTRFPRLIASQAAVFRSHLEVVCPLLSADVIDLVRACTAAQRADKRHIAECVRVAFPDDFALPLNEVHSRTSWRIRLRELGPVPRFLVQTLLEPSAPFDAWFDRTTIRAWLAQAVAEGGQTAWPSGSGWLRRSVATARALLLRPTFKERVVLNLVTLKLWLGQQDSAHHP